MSSRTGLDELVDGAGLERIEPAMKIAEREWSGIRLCLEMCGDTGGFDRSRFMVGTIDEDVITKKPQFCATKSVDVNSPSYYPMYFVKNLLEMDSQMPERGYNTEAALYCQIELVTAAAVALGLSGTMAMGFACGYGVARTGWLAEKGLRRERDFFVETFFEDCAKNCVWKPGWRSTQEKMKKIFDRFVLWQKDADTHLAETAEERKVKPLLV